MSDTTITPEERSLLKKIHQQGWDIDEGDMTIYRDVDGEAMRLANHFENPEGITRELAQVWSTAWPIVARLLAALEASEAARDKALQMNVERQAAITETAINALLACITGEKESVGLKVSGYHCPYCGETSKTVEDATAHDAACPKHPAVVRAVKAEADLSRVKGAGIEALRRAEQAEAENARLTAERDWLAQVAAEDARDAAVDFDSYGEDVTAEYWKEAARRAVAGEGEPS